MKNFLLGLVDRGYKRKFAKGAIEGYTSSKNFLKNR